jgi:cytochrome c553
MRLMLKDGMRVAGVLLAMTAALAVQAQGDATRGKQIGYTCLGCHGIEDYKNVYPTYSVPKLVGQHPEYIEAALKAYRSRERSHATMYAQASSLSDQDIADVAAYLAGTALGTGGTAVGQAPAKVVELCAVCHGKDGVGIVGMYPTLAGQHADYLERALTEYQKGDRKNAVMGPFAAQLSAADIKQIAAYFAAQQPPLKTVARKGW